jgi:EAL and modified HD-GYP domain-containing signal transduction protein
VDLDRSDDAPAWLVDEIEAAVAPDLRHEFAARVAREPVLVARQGIFTETGRLFAYELSFRSAGTHPEQSGEWSAFQHERATSHVLSASFGRDHLERLARGRIVFVRCPRPFLVGDLPLPARPDRLVVEVTDTEVADDAVLAGIARLRERGFRIALPGFAATAAQLLLVPMADFVKIDARDLDVEGEPVLRAAASSGALLVGEFVENHRDFQHARTLGLTLFQGNLLERAAIVDRSDARPVRTP